MEDDDRFQLIIDKLQKGMLFGLFEDGQKCYFRDGTRVSYLKLWEAIRLVNNIEEGKYAGTLTEQCPNTFIGSFIHEFVWHNWKKNKSNSVPRLFNYRQQFIKDKDK